MVREAVIISVFLLGWALIYLVYILFKGKLKGKISVGAFYIYCKTNRLNTLFNEFTDKHRGKINKFLLIGEITCLIAMFYSIYLLLNGIYRSIALRGAPAVVPILPGITVSFETFAKMLPAIIIIVFLHEFLHKIAFRTGGLETKSVGVGLFLIFPFAFVEPDEERFKKTSPSFKMKVLAAGSFINIVTAAMFAPLIYFPSVYEGFLSPFYGPSSGIIVVGIGENSPIENSTNIEVGDVIVRINNVAVNSMSDFEKLELKPNEKVSIYYYKRRDLEVGKPILKSDQLFTVASSVNASKGVIGILLYPRELWPLMTYYPPKLRGLPLNLPATLFEILMWIFILSFSIGVINMLPLYPLDGYGFLESMLDRLKVKDKAKKIALKAASIISLILLALNFIYPLLGA